jgi:hypothetical protein
MDNKKERIPVSQMPNWLQQGIASENTIPHVPPPPPVEQPPVNDPLLFEVPDYINQGYAAIERAKQKQTEQTTPKTRLGKLLASIVPIKDPIKGIQEGTQHQQNTYLPTITKGIEKGAESLRKYKTTPQAIAETTIDFQSSGLAEAAAIIKDRPYIAAIVITDLLRKIESSLLTTDDQVNQAIRFFYDNIKPERKGDHSFLIREVTEVLRLYDEDCKTRNPNPKTKVETKMIELMLRKAIYVDPKPTLPFAGYGRAE